MQKEYFSPYIFEDEAAEMLRNNPELKAELKNLQKVPTLNWISFTKSRNITNLHIDVIQLCES